MWHTTLNINKLFALGGPFAIISGLISFKYRIRALQIDFEDLKRWQKLYAVSSMWEKNYPQDKHCKHKKRWLKLLNKCNKYILCFVWSFRYHRLALPIFLPSSQWINEWISVLDWFQSMINRPIDRKTPMILVNCIVLCCVRTGACDTSSGSMKNKYTLEPNHFDRETERKRRNEDRNVTHCATICFGCLSFSQLCFTIS